VVKVRLRLARAAIRPGVARARVMVAEAEARAVR
jgi:hypothetical protein